MEPIYHFVKTREGGYHSGIPSRDLTEADVKALTDEQRATVEASKLYRKIERAPSDDAKPAGRTAGGKV